MNPLSLFNRAVFVYWMPNEWKKKKEMHFYHSLEKVWIREGSEYTCKRNIVMEKKKKLKNLKK